MDQKENCWAVAQVIADGLNFLPVCDNQKLAHSIGEYLLEEAVDYITTYHDADARTGLEELEKETDRRLNKIYTEGTPSSVRVFECDLWGAVANSLDIERD